MNIKKILIGMTLISSALSVSAQSHIDSDSSSATADDAVRLIREDRMWEYVRYTGVAYEREIIQLQFEGTEVVDGVEYSLLNVRNHFKTNSGTNSYLDLMSENGVPIEHKPVRMRESEGRIYRIYDKAGCDSEPNEVLIMDFNLNKDEDANLHVGYSFLARPIKEILFPEELDVDYKMTVFDTDTEIVDGEICRSVSMTLHMPIDPSYSFGYFQIVEGIGPVKCTKAPDVERGPLREGTIAMLEHYDDVTAFPDTGFFLNNVYNAKKQIIYSGLNYNWYADSVGWTGVEQVDEGMEEIRYYDMQGHRILNPTGSEKILKKSPDGKSVIVISGN